MSKTCGIYAIVNTNNGKYYWGSSVDINARWLKHTSCLNGQEHHNDHLQYAWDKYGEDSFKFMVVEKVFSSESLLEREQWYLDWFFEDSYNIARCATAPALGMSWTEETMQKIKESWTPEMRKKRSKKYSGENNPFWGKTHSEETKQKIREAWTPERKKAAQKMMTNRIVSEETKEKRSRTLTGRKLSEEHVRKMSEAGKKLWENKEYRERMSGENAWSYGKKHTAEELRKMSEANKGENNARAVLSKKDIKRIKMLFRDTDRTGASISREYKVHPMTISNIKTGKTWKHVKI